MATAKQVTVQTKRTTDTTVVIEEKGSVEIPHPADKGKQPVKTSGASEKVEMIEI